MCGISGIIRRTDQSADVHRNEVEKSIAQLYHRGPDDNGIFIQDSVAFGHARLSILDLSDAGHQPMACSESKFLITYNGEVYNFKELRNQLGLKKCNLQSATDTEVILEYFKLKGTKSFVDLDGMFAFAIYDFKLEKVYLVRDRFGIKPLYYFSDQDKIIFSSEIKAFKGYDIDINSIDINALPEWIYYGNPLREKTLYNEIKKVLPGHYIEIDLKTLNVKEISYWSPELIPEKKVNFFRNRQPIVKKVQKLLEDAVRKQLVSDVPVGIFLSGGIDSSAITAFASKHYDNDLHTYSVGFDFDGGINELPKALKIAKQFNTSHHELTIGSYDLADTIEKLVYIHDSPFSDAANIPLFLLGKELEGTAKVILQGDGGDEIFGGYRRYNTLSLMRYWKPIISIFSQLHQYLPRNKDFFIRNRYLNALNFNNEAELMALLLTVEDKYNNHQDIFSKSIQTNFKDIDPFQAYKDCDSRFANKDIVQKMLFTDSQIILPDIFLEKVDRSTMASSIEVRVPFLDNALTNYALSLPSKIKVRHGQKKWLLKKALINILPNEILFGKKTGFGVPYQYWIKGPLLELFYDKKNELKNLHPTILNWKYIDCLMVENRESVNDHSFILWKILNLMIWLINQKDLNFET